ncbi:MAG: S41 family peptidase [Gemmatimonadales bacterium]|nr:S41 family peptidase [Gemmatimonadales bacterium]
MQRRWTVPAALALVVCFTSGWFLQSRMAVNGDVYRQARLFEEVLSHVRDHHVDSLAESELYLRASDGLLSQLNDPYAALLRGRDWEKHVERTTGDYAGIGLLVDARNGWITVVSPMQGSPADRAGIRSGDVLFQVDGLSAADWTLDQAVQAMRGKAGSRIEVAIQREETLEPVRYTLVRERIHQRAVPAGVLLPDSIGYLSMTMVRENAAEELEEEVERLTREGMRALVLDLRFNPGGLRDEAVEAADLFLDPRQEILVSRGRAPGDNHRWSDSRPQRWRSLPIVVLVNGGSASAAEIIAGALQDHDRALLVGDTTYGKGIVQTVFPLGPELALRMTTARWYTPSGRSIQGASLDSAMGAKASAARQISYRSTGGRPLSGWGGIVPDVVLGPDTLTTPESLLAQALSGQISVFRDVLTAYALELRRQGAIATPEFEVTPVMRAEVHRRLNQRGMAIADSVFSGGERVVATQLGYEVARYLFGLAAERERRVVEDVQVQEAVALLRGTSSPQALLGMAEPGSRQAH